MTAITINCYSTNFTAESRAYFCALEQKDVFGPMLLPMTTEQRNAAMKIFLELQPERHEETGQLCACIGSSYLYVDSALFDDLEVVHFQLAISQEPNERITSIVFDILTAATLIADLPETKLLISVPSTPTDRLPTDWMSALHCKSPLQMQGLLDAEYQALDRSLSRFRQR